MKKRYADISLPGSFMADQVTIPVKDDTTPQELLKARPSSFRVHFFTRTEVLFPRTKAGGDTEVLQGKPEYEPKSYLAGRAYTLAELKTMNVSDTLIANVEGNGWKGAVKCRPGNWQPWTDDVEVLEVR